MYKRSKVFGKSKLIADANNAFPFLKLPPEIRNMIYRYLVVSRSDAPINLSDISKWYTAGGIQTAILSTNKQVMCCLVRLNSVNKWYPRSSTRLPRSSIARTDVKLLGKWFWSQII